MICLWLIIMAPVYRIMNTSVCSNYFATDDQSASLSSCRAPIWTSWPTTFLFSVWQLRVSCCGAPLRARGWVCNLLVQLLLGLARAVTLGPKSLRTHDHILLSHLTLPQPGRPSSRIYIPEEQGGPVIPPGTGFAFRHLLRLAGLRWRYSNPSPHGVHVIKALINNKYWNSLFY
jgi:hypothetical protein